MVAVKRRIRAHILESLVKENGWRIGAELGVLRGDTFLHLLRACPDLAMVGVDLWQYQPDKDACRDEGGRSYLNHDLEGYYAALKDALTPFAERAALLRMDTVEAAGKFPDRHFDFVFIDADHTYEGVSRDIDAWLPKVRPGGRLIGHDYDRAKFRGVVRAVDERFPHRTLYPDHVWGTHV